MTNRTQIEKIDFTEAEIKEIEAMLYDAFVNGALNNHGRLMVGRYANEVSMQIRQLAQDFVQEHAQDEDVATLAADLAKKGLAISSGHALMRVLAQLPWLTTSVWPSKAIQNLSHFQLLFMDHLFAIRTQLKQVLQEKTQYALQKALQMQLSQQRQQRLLQEQQKERSQAILALNGELTTITDEQSLLDTAVSGVRRALDLAYVAFYQRDEKADWLRRTTTQASLMANTPIPDRELNFLNSTEIGQETVRRDTPDSEDGEILYFVSVLRVSETQLGGIVARSNSIPYVEIDEALILLRTFTQNFAALWANNHLLAETRQRTQELEILYGRHVDTIWRTDTASLQAQYHNNHFTQRDQLQPQQHPPDLSFPLLVSEQPIGEVALSHVNNLSDEDKEFAQALVRDMGNALNNAYLIQTTRANANMLNLATEVSRAATTILDRDVLIQEVVELIRARFNYYYVGLFLVDEARYKAVLQAGTGEAGRIQLSRNHHQIIGSGSMIGTTIATGESIVEQDVTQAQSFRFNPILPDTRSELALPLRVRGEAIGALTVQSVEKNAFSHNAVAILQSLSDQLAVSIENAGLFAQIQATLAETSRLYQTGRQVSEAESIEEVYDVLLEYIQLSDNVDFAIFLMHDANTPNYFVSERRWSRGEITFAPPGYFPVEKFPHTAEMKKNELVLVKDTLARSDLEETGRKEMYQKNQFRTSAYLPIFAEGEWLGTLVLHRTKLIPFTREDVQPYQTLADQAAIVIANYQLLNEIQNANRRLRELDQLKTQFLANMSHELRTPLNSIIGFSRVILKGIDGPITSEQEEDLTSIHSNGQHLLGLINEILDMAKIEAGKMSLSYEMTSLENIAKKVLNDIRPLVKSGVQLTWDIAPNLPHVEADPIRIRQIFTNLLSNAAKFTENGNIHLQMVLQDTEYVHIVVKDSGIGIDPKEHDVLFKAFEQVDSSPTRAVGGTGLGLPITKWMITMHQGRIWFESDVGKGTTFHIQLPIHQPEEKRTDLTFDESLTVGD